MWPILGCSLFLLLPDHSISAAVPRPNGRTFPATDAFDRVVTDFMLANGIVGASVAVTVRGKVAYEQGYGAANVMAGSLVQPSSVFRIASLTKMHTSAAILLLEQQGKLRLSDTVFGPPPSLLSNLTGTPPSYPGANVDPRLRKITLRHLLHHIGGWCARGRGDAAVCNAPDPMFEPKTVCFPSIRSCAASVWRIQFGGNGQSRGHDSIRESYCAVCSIVATVVQRSCESDRTWLVHHKPFRFPTMHSICQILLCQAVSG